MRSPFMRAYSKSLAPIGHVNFCKNNTVECRSDGRSFERVKLSEEAEDQLVTVNSLVNRIIQPVTDYELYGTVEYWTYPDNKGDCEDYVLLKRRYLMEYGWPASALLVTVVTDEAGEGHAVLTIRTSKGDMILDNKVPQVKLWNDTRYRFYKRQSYRNPADWVSLIPSNTTARKVPYMAGN
jgi:predicted transglutaminase-like cysteine proteinase